MLTVRLRSAHIGSWLASLLVATVGGCAPEHLISFEEFLKMQQTAEAAHAQEQSASPTVAVDLGEALGPVEVGPSDVLIVTVVDSGEAQFVPSLRARVNRDGTINLPVIGTVSVGGKNLVDVEDAIRSAYVPSVLREAMVHVELVEPELTKVLVVGAVTEPGLIPLQRNQRNLLYAIVGAGGASNAASGNATLQRIRSPGVRHSFDLRDPIQLQQALALTPLEDGDIVSVEAAQPNTVYVGGLVHGIGPQQYPPSTEVTILQALAGAGGLRTDVAPRIGTLTRRMPDGNDVHVKLDLNRLATGLDPNIALVPGDILWVPDTWDTRVEDFINRNIFLRAGVSVTYSVTGVEFMNRNSQQGGNGGSGSQENNFDPLGFLGRNQALQGIQNTVVP